MKREKIFKKHHNREDLAGEYVWGDAGQAMLLGVFLVVWIFDSFFLKYSILFAEAVPLFVRILSATVVFCVSGYLAKKGLTLVFGEVREEPAVIRKGVFRVVRHPIYLAAILFYLGLVL